MADLPLETVSRAIGRNGEGSVFLHRHGLVGRLGCNSEAQITNGDVSVYITGRQGIAMRIGVFAIGSVPVQATCARKCREVEGKQVAITHVGSSSRGPCDEDHSMRSVYLQLTVAQLGIQAFIACVGHYVGII